jgi:hypothetical protein
MKTIYYFLEWHWKKYTFDYIDLIPIFGLSILLAFFLGAIGYKVLAGFIVFVVLVAFVLALIKGLIIDPIRKSFREYKEEQRALLNKINYGDKDYDRYRQGH